MYAFQLISAGWIENDENDVHDLTQDEIQNNLKQLSSCVKHHGKCREENPNNIGCIPESLNFMCNSYNKDLCSSGKPNESNTCVCCSKYYWRPVKYMEAFEPK